MPGRKASEDIYVAVLRHLVQRAKQQDIKVDLTTKFFNVMADFEKGERNALTKVFPKAKVHGCGFHYCQALMRQVGLKGLLKAYKEDADFRYYIRKYMMLMLLPLQSIHKVANDLEAMAPEFVPRKYNRQWLEWISYFRNTWIHGRFQPKEWNRYRTELGTNNLAENLNRQAVDEIGRHPDLWRWIVWLQGRVHRAWIRSKQLEQHGRTHWKGNDERKKDAAIINLWDSLDRGDTAPIDFLELCSKAMHLHFNSVEMEIQDDLDEWIEMRLREEEQTTNTLENTNTNMSL